MCDKSRIPINSNADVVTTTLKGMETPEHTKVYSRTLRRDIEIDVGMHGDNKVPANPFASARQARFAHANPSKFGGKAGLSEWDKSTDFSKIPERVKK